MTYTRKQVVTCLSVLYLVVATALAGCAASRANNHSVPISDTLTGLTTALPILAGLLLELGYDLTRRQEKRQHLNRGQIQRPPLVIVANTIIFIYSTVVITLLGTHAAPPSGLDCTLRETWQKLFKHKDRESIRRIQDAFNCCGFANSRDMAWPFPDRSHDQHSCENTYGRTTGCLGAWKAEEQRLAGILMAVVGMVFLWQFAIIAIPTQKESWLHKVAPDRISRMIADERHGGTEEPRRAIDYSPRYSDRVEEDEDDIVNYSARTLENGTQGVGHTAAREQQPAVENEWARN
ncbi:hypothetical protein ACN47E_006669 [Coniothyrium glycines]